MAQLALPAFSRLVRGTGCHPRRSKSNHKTSHFTANAAFCRLIFLQLPSSQLDMAEACGSRICDDRSNRQCLCGVAHHTLLPISAFCTFWSQTFYNSPLDGIPPC